MGARVESKFEKGFLLSEENLIRLDDIVRRRVGQQAETSLRYRVYRSDDFYVDYETVAQVVNEENSKRNLVRQLRMSLGTEPLTMSLKFAKTDGVSLSIEADDRDLAFLLASDVKEYLGTEVLKRGPDLGSLISSEKFFSATIILMMVIMPLVLGYSLFGDDRVEPSQHLMKSNNIHEKLNFLLEQRKELDKGRAGLIPVFGLLIFISGIIILRSFKTSLVSRIFYWGKEVPRYDRWKTLKDRIVWGVIIAFIIGVLATMFSTNILGL